VGRAPIWRYGMALHLLHGSPAAAVAFYDPRLGAVVVTKPQSLIHIGPGYCFDHTRTKIKNHDHHLSG
jgi:CRISPR-associated Csx3 family protein